MNRAKPWRTATLAVTIALLAVPSLLAQEEEKPPPKIAMSLPLAIEAGTTSKLVLRGWQIDQSSAVKAAEGIEVKVLKKEAAPVPGGQDAKMIGDQQLEIEMTLPADYSGGDLSLVAVTPAGESEPYRVLVGAEHPRTEEKEPNDGFRQGQAIGELPCTIDGQIHGDRNVDVFALEVEAGRRLRAELTARRRGSALDGILTLYDAAGNIVASSDDAQQADPRLEASIAESGRYFLALQDAHDQGGPAHAYRLTVGYAAE